MAFIDVASKDTRHHRMTFESLRPAQMHVRRIKLHMLMGTWQGHLAEEKSVRNGRCSQVIFGKYNRGHKSSLLGCVQIPDPQDLRA